MAGKGKKGGNDGSGDGINEIKGNRKDNLLIGTDGDDRILAGLGNDEVFAGLGDDFVWGDGGNDTLYGEEGDDRLLGLSGDDILIGGIGNDTLEGGDGDDILQGGAGDDYLAGNLGTDTLDGGSMTGEVNTAAFDSLGGDGDPDAGIVLTAGASSGEYLVSYEIAPSVTETDTLFNIHRVIGSNYEDIMTGGTANDYFIGAYGDDLLSGGDGDDKLIGGLDNDTLVGGNGHDTFVFHRYADGNPDTDDAGIGDGADVILDFNTAEDMLIFCSNEALDITAFTAEVIDGSTIITYEAAPDFFGPSTVTLDGVDLSDPVSGEIDLTNASFILVEPPEGFV